MILTPEFFIEHGFEPINYNRVKNKRSLEYQYEEELIKLNHFSIDFMYENMLILYFHLDRLKTIDIVINKPGRSHIIYANDYTLDEFNSLCRALRIQTINKIINTRQTIPEDGC